MLLSRISVCHYPHDGESGSMRHSITVDVRLVQSNQLSRGFVLLKTLSVRPKIRIWNLTFFLSGPARHDCRRCDSRSHVRDDSLDGLHDGPALDDRLLGHRVLFGDEIRGVQRQSVAV